jgi:transposase
MTRSCAPDDDPSPPQRSWWPLVVAAMGAPARARAGRGRREDLVQTRTQAINRLHRLLVDLVPAGAGRNLVASRAAALLGQVTPTGAAGVTRHQLARELIADVHDLDRRIADLEKRIKAAVAQSKSNLVGLFGVGPVLAAKLLGEVGDISRFPTKHHFAAHTGTAPLEASSGQVVRHRLSRAGDRKLNHALYLMAIVQIRHPTARAGLLSAQAGREQVGQGSAALSQTRLSDAVYRCLLAAA